MHNFHRLLILEFGEFLGVKAQRDLDMLGFLKDNNEKLLLKKVWIQTTDNQNNCSERYLLPEMRTFNLGEPREEFTCSN